MLCGRILILMLAIAVIAGCGGGGNPPGPDVDALVTQGKADLVNGTATAARENFSQAVQSEPDNPDANWGLGIIELMRQANTTALALAASNELPFRNASMLAVSAAPLPPVAGHRFSDATRLCSFIDTGFPETDVDDMTGNEVYQVIADAIAGVERALAYFDTALANADSGFSFEIPSDWNDPAAGTITISRADALTITAAVKYIDGLLNLAAAYDFSQFSLEKDEYGDFQLVGAGASADPIDANSDSFYDLGEIATANGWPDAAGLKRADGGARLTMLVQQWRGAFNYLVEAGDLYAAGDELAGHWAFDPHSELTPDDVNDLRADWSGYIRSYTQQFADAMTSGTVLTLSAALLADQPGFEEDYPENFSLPLNLNAFFTHLPDDLRDVPVRMELTEDPWLGTTYAFPPLVTDGFTDATMLGAFTGGLSQANYEWFFLP
jgi:hypothetical protein